MAIPIEDIVKSLENRTCIFLLGPKLAIDKEGRALQPGLITYFKAKQVIIEEDMDNLYRCNPQNKNRAYMHLKDYYRNNGEPTDLHRKLARLPCHLYISINPDLLMKQALEEFGVEHEFKFYIKGQPPDPVAPPTAEKPLLYNLFGSIDSQQSLILTQDDLIQYMRYIIKDFNLPQNLRDSLNSSLYFVFLGFDFEKWYLRLLLKMFLDESKIPIASETECRTQDRLRAFYRDNYGLEFVDDHIEAYVDALFQECNRQLLLRPLKAKTQNSIQKEIRDLIRKDAVRKALERLYQFLEDLDEQAFKDKAEDKLKLLNDIDNHFAVLSETEADIGRGVIKEEDVGVVKSKIRIAVTEIAQRFST